MTGMSKIYTTEYDDELLRGVEEPRPWNITDEIAEFITPASLLIDVGCGTCTKTLNLAKKVKSFWGVEPSAEMREKVTAEISRRKIANARIIDGKADNLPFPDDYCDILTCILALHSASEFSRVLKPGGVAVMEKLTERDKREIKAFFGRDENGLRGQFSEFATGERTKKIRLELETYFKSVRIQEGKWRAYLSTDGLVKLCQETSIVRGFDRDKDAEALRRAICHLKEEKGVRIEHHRILIIAEK
jgi:SAM-dependent methyltransferase